MRLLTLAAGLATGYVLGTRAGRGKYEQIVDNARLLRANPTAGQALNAVTNLFETTQATEPPVQVTPAGADKVTPATIPAKPRQARTATDSDAPTA